MGEGNDPRKPKDMLSEANNASEVMVILSAAIGESDNVVPKPRVFPGFPSDGRTLEALHLATGAPEGLEPLAEPFGQELEELRE